MIKLKLKYKQKNTKTFKLLVVLILMVIIVFLSGCKKFLDKKPNVSDVIPSNVNDLQALLDNARNLINARGVGAYAELLADNYYVPYSNWQSAMNIIPSEPVNYIWGDLTIDNYWTSPYTGPIYYSNVVIDQLSQITINPGEEEKKNNLRGAALFYRAFAFQWLAQLYCKPYSTENANELGIVLKVSSNVSEKVGRATVQETYDRIINDLKEAATLLPEISTLPLTLHTRPSKTAAYSALARTYLSMRDYVNAAVYANQALQQYSKLMDYDSLASKPLPIGSINKTNEEIIFYDFNSAPFLFSSANQRIDSFLYASYDANDLRKKVYFNSTNPNSIYFQGSYNGINTNAIFDGLTTDELYLIKAECFARAGNKDSAMTTLNNLLKTRWKKMTGGGTTYVNQGANDAIDALNKILVERRKELAFRGLRWSDIRRLNVESSNITLKRNLNGTIYTLPPNDKRSVMLIALTEIIYNPNIEQNPR